MEGHIDVDILVQQAMYFTSSFFEFVDPVITRYRGCKLTPCKVSKIMRLTFLENEVVWGTEIWWGTYVCPPDIKGGVG